MKKLTMTLFMAIIMTFCFAVVAYAGENCCDPEFDGLQACDEVNYDLGYISLRNIPADLSAIPSLEEMMVLFEEEIKELLEELGFANLDELFTAQDFTFNPRLRNISCCGVPSIFTIARTTNGVNVWIQYCRNCVTIFSLTDMWHQCIRHRVDVNAIWLYLFANRPVR